MTDDRKRSTEHEPVLLQEVIGGLAIAPNDIVFDGTVGGGGHAEAICLILGRTGTYIGCDMDGGALLQVRARVKDTCPALNLVKANFRDLPKILDKLEIPEVTKVLLDLGLSSDELESSGRGFSFRKEEEPLLMTFDNAPREEDLTARVIVNEWAEDSIADILWGFGGERRARRIAAEIIAARQERPIETVGDLNAIVAKVGGRRGRIHPSTRTFQALRMAVNDETGSLAEAIQGALLKLSKGGRLAIISFESITDRMVKRAFRNAADDKRGTLITKHPLIPTDEELERNPRARSAKLRIFEKS